MTTNTVTRPTSATVRNLAIVTILLSAIVGGVTGYAANAFSRPSTAAQNREFFLFAQDLHFGNNQMASGLTSDYIYSSTHITVNKGDSITIHFYNPTDQAHSFTIGSPYANDVTVQPANNTTIAKQDIALTASTPGIFVFHCKFHSPQMVGTITVQG